MEVTKGKATGTLKELLDNIDPMEVYEERIKMTLWKDAQGEELPEIDREVIVLEETNYDALRVCFAHRIDPQSDGMPCKGGWNIPCVKWWLDLEIPE